MNISITPTFIHTPTSFSIVSFTPVYTPSSTGSSKSSALTESGKVPPSIDEPGIGETQRSIFNMTEEEIVALEERARNVGGTGKSPFAHRSPFASATSSLSPHTSSTCQSISSVQHTPHIKCSKYFKGFDEQHIEDTIEEKKCRDVPLGQTAFDAARKVRVFHLCQEPHDVPE